MTPYNPGMSEEAWKKLHEFVVRIEQKRKRVAS